MSECKHPNFFFKEYKFYCRTCGEEESFMKYSMDFIVRKNDR